MGVPEWPEGPWRWQPRIFGVSNQKGGSGKTTTTVNLGAELAAHGARVRLIDMDPQLGSATHWLPPDFGDTDPRLRSDLKDVLLGMATLDQATWPTAIPGVFIVPSYHTLTQFEQARPIGAEHLLAQALDQAEVFDATAIDCPPTLGLLTVAALAAIMEAIIACKPGSLDLVGVADLNATLALVRDRLNTMLTVAAVVMTMRQLTKFAGQIELQLMADYPHAVHQSIRHTVRAQEAPSVHLPLREYAPGATATIDYARLAWRLYHPEEG